MKCSRKKLFSATGKCLLVASSSVANLKSNFFFLYKCTNCKNYLFNTKHEYYFIYYGDYVKHYQC